MRKKIISALLLGLFTVASTSTFVSCKDYDDDISNLQTQVNSLSDLVTQKEATINSSIEALKTSIAQANTDHATKAALEAAQKTLQAAIDANYSSLTAKDAELSAAITKAQAQADAAAKLAEANSTTIGNVKSELTTSIQKVADDLATANEKLNTLSAGLTQANADIAALNAALTAQKTELTAALGNQKETLEAELASVKSELEKAQAAQKDELVAALNQQKQDLEAEISALSTTVETTKKDLEEADKKNLQLALDSVTSLQKAVSEQMASLETSLKNEIAKVQADEEKLSEKEAADYSELKSLHEADASNITENQTKIAALQTQATELAAQIQAVDAKYDKITTALAKDLRSLVFIPNLYVDGIEAIEYPYLDGNALKKSSTLNTSRKHSYETETKYITDYYDYIPSTDTIMYGPAWAVDYHMNPSSCSAVAGDVKGYAVREAEVITRANSAALGVTSPSLYDDGTTLFKNNAGILTAGLKIAKPYLLKGNGPVYTGAGATGNTSYGVDNIVALQVNSQYNGKDTLITSDYALLYGEPVVPEALIWNQSTNKKTYRNFDNDCSYLTSNKKVHIYDNPTDALVNEPAFDLLYQNDSIDLKKYIETHYVRNCATKSAQVPGTWKWGEEKKWGLHYEFETVDYKVQSNKTIDSKYCHLENGVIAARNVDNNGNTMTTQSESSVDREPLVRVKLMKGTKVVLDGYILIRITREIPGTPKKPNLTITEFENQGKANYTLCDAADAQKTTWAQFSKWVLTDEMDNMTKEDFDNYYALDVTSDPIVTLADGGKQAHAVLYKNTNGTIDTYNTPAEQLGQMLYIYDSEGVNNHTFQWSFDEKELEYLTHDVTTPVTKTQYVRYHSINSESKYEYIYVKFDATITRSNVAKSGVAEKNDNYWFGLDGNDNGWDAIALNIGFPQDGINPTTWRSEQLETFIKNQVGSWAAANRKFFFQPTETTITDQHGVEWTITARSGNSDTNWNSLVCVENLHSATTHTWTSATAIGDVLNKCKIAYASGVFTNNKLYAVKTSEYSTKSAYTQIAVMNQTNGEIEFVRNATSGTTPNTATANLYSAPLDMVLNALGYQENHANISTELHTWVGIAVKGSCEYAIDVYTTPGDNNKTYGIWEASWQRPINMDNTQPREIYDAKDNGEYISVFDLLSFYDWRGPVVGKGNMEGDHKWLWAYYNIYGIKVNVDPQKVTTDMHGGTLGTTTLASRSNLVHLRTVNKTDGTGIYGTLFTNTFNLTSYNKASLNSSFLTWLDNNKDIFGYIYYENNGDNVTDFTVRIPIEVMYEWGHFDTTVDVLIHRSLGNAKGRK